MALPKQSPSAGTWACGREARQARAQIPARGSTAPSAPRSCRGKEGVQRAPPRGSCWSGSACSPGSSLHHCCQSRTGEEQNQGWKVQGQPVALPWRQQPLQQTGQVVLQKGQSLSGAEPSPPQTLPFQGSGSFASSLYWIHSHFPGERGCRPQRSNIHSGTSLLFGDMLPLPREGGREKSPGCQTRLP